MFSFFWPEYSCNTSSQVILLEDELNSSTAVTYLEDEEKEGDD